MVRPQGQLNILYIQVPLALRNDDPRGLEG